jgi:hypothetical protein
LLIFLTHAITVLGILALVAGFFLTFIPLIKNYGRMLKIGGTVLLLIGIYFEGGLAAEMEWRRRVSEMEEKVKVIEKKVVITNTKIQTKVVEKIKVIKEKGQIQKQYIEKEIVKYNDKCVIPKEFIQVVNEAAASPSGGKDE